VSEVDGFGREGEGGMRVGRLGVSGVVAMAACLFASGASAEPNDLHLNQILTNGTIDTNAQQRFRMLGDELGMALSSTTMEPSYTLGINGFDFAFETAFVFVNSTAQVGGSAFWSATENTPPSTLYIPSLHFRKGLPYSFEFGARLSTVGDSSMFSGQAELKWGILEGFRYAPDLSARFAMTRLFGSNDFDSTSGAVDVQLGKQIGIAGMFTLTPYVGYAATGIDSSPRVIWGTPVTPAQYQASPISQQVLFAEEKWQNNIYDRFYAGLIVTIYLVSISAEYDFAHPSAFSSNSGSEAAYPIEPGISTLGVRLSLTL
jgi:hypothetical protein